MLRRVTTPPDPEATPRAPDPAATPRRRRNPWWIPPFLGRVPEIEDRYFRILGIVALGLFFESYDLSLLTSALMHISEDLGMAEHELGFYLGAIRLGGLAAFLLLPLADRLGRRRVFLASLIGMSLFTLGTAFAQTPLQFVVFQLLTRAFIATLSAVGIVMLAEEFPAAHRGWGVGILGALAASGHGLGAALFATIDIVPFGWRALYALGALPLLLLPYFRRELQETKRFRRHQEETAGSRGGITASLQSLVALARGNPRRAALVGGSGLILALGSISVFQFAALFVQSEHGWLPWHYSVMLLTSGGVGIIGNVVAGRLGDRAGRRAVGVAAFTLFPIAGIAFYNGSGWLLPLAFIAVVFSSSAGDVIVRIFSTELFPTAQRGASAAWLTLLQTVGWILGLWLVGLGRWAGVSLPMMISVVSAAVLVAGLLVLRLPETRQRELEEISDEREPAAG
jgi:putative MFS transporter